MAMDFCAEFSESDVEPAAAIVARDFCAEFSESDVEPDVEPAAAISAPVRIGLE